MHKCNKCYQQAVVKTEKGNEEFCLTFDKAITLQIKNCTEFIDNQTIKEPFGPEEDLSKLLVLLQNKPKLSEIKKLINKIKVKTTMLRAWGRKQHRPKIRNS